MEQRRNFPEPKQGAPAISPIQLSENQRELLHTELFQLAGPLDSILTGGQVKLKLGKSRGVDFIPEFSWLNHPIRFFLLKYKT